MASLPRQRRLEILDGLTEEQLAALQWDWRFWARPEQIAPPGDWSTWLALAGRGFGKTEAGAQWVKERVDAGARMVALIAETQKDLEEVMVARLLSIYPPGKGPVARFKPVRLTWPCGAVAYGYNGTEPNQLRGPEFDTAWVDELAKYRYARETWDMLQFTMRRPDPRVFVTTTPRPIPVLREILADQSTVVTRGSTFDNAANLPRSFIDRLRDLHEGTRLGRQELYAEILDEAEGALWNRDMLAEAQSKEPPEAFARVVVAVDPAATSNPHSDETGIIVAGATADKRAHVIADGSGRMTPGDWAKRVIDLFHAYGADRIVAEGNQGGEMVSHTIRTQWPAAPVKIVHASRAKVARAEPVAALYEQGRVSHAPGLDALEDQMVTWEPMSGLPSPDRVDALVWALTELIVKRPHAALAEQQRRPQRSPLDDYAPLGHDDEVEEWKIV